MCNTEKHIEREKRTIAKMIGLYCNGNKHSESKVLCADCKALLAYAAERIERCPVRETKDYCSACEIHCYKPEMRERIRTVMRYSGPRMLWHDPFLALSHLMAMKRKKSDNQGNAIDTGLGKVGKRP